MRRQLLRQISKERRWPNARLLGSLSDAFVSRMVKFAKAHDHENVCSEVAVQRRGRQMFVPKPDAFADWYSQIALQRLKPGGCAEIPSDFIEPVLPDVMMAINIAVGPVYRARITRLRRYQEIPEQSDDPHQIRVIGLLSGVQEFHIGDQPLKMQIGELWFVNTALRHSIRNPGSADRFSLLLNLFDIKQVAE